MTHSRLPLAPAMVSIRAMVLIISAMLLSACSSHAPHNACFNQTSCNQNSFNQLSADSIYVHAEKPYAEKVQDLIQRLEQEYQPPAGLIAIIVATRSSESGLYQLQMKTLQSVDAEQQQLLYVTADAESEDRDQYFVGMKDSAALLGAADFRILLITDDGIAWSATDEVVSAPQLSAILTAIRSK
ncbi:MAG: hypothetical protein CMI08_10825 [Oceanospirillaceae bacterium]|uniref:hypothetical protein n=2 Tax=unclassified Thalassolituus TaxID=2624967 RepID=UPI000C4ACDEE|nr:hypothetical protein [Thalassolituus sp. UBA6592]MAS24166.1 hypothetical protein [Oceanospirillaceae bacterium]MAX99673.1 hypothetical protein [Oceanospirillaceae bacterium]MBL35422.1 hypothetical protein [Oceanospirillaceae bacterium]MBS51895.1 hypothetical protein [Oceanospirillaceae bacterium]|tara:strand:- start:193 stop:747 length:555 start_codon:yes stop_codon:yes gene_type:complete